MRGGGDTSASSTTRHGNSLGYLMMLSVFCSDSRPATLEALPWMRIRHPILAKTEDISDFPHREYRS